MIQSALEPCVEGKPSWLTVTVLIQPFSICWGNLGFRIWLARLSRWSWFNPHGSICRLVHNDTCTPPPGDAFSGPSMWEVASCKWRLLLQVARCKLQAGIMQECSGLALQAGIRLGPTSDREQPSTDRTRVLLSACCIDPFFSCRLQKYMKAAELDNVVCLFVSRSCDNVCALAWAVSTSGSEVWGKGLSDNGDYSWHSSPLSLWYMV